MLHATGQESVMRIEFTIDEEAMVETGRIVGTHEEEVDIRGLSKEERELIMEVLVMSNNPDVDFKVLDRVECPWTEPVEVGFAPPLGSDDDMPRLLLEHAAAVKKVREDNKAHVERVLNPVYADLYADPDNEIEIEDVSAYDRERYRGLIEKVAGICRRRTKDRVFRLLEEALEGNQPHEQKLVGGGFVSWKLEGKKWVPEIVCSNRWASEPGCTYDMGPIDEGDGIVHEYVRMVSEWCEDRVSALSRMAEEDPIGFVRSSMDDLEGLVPDEWPGKGGPLAEKMWEDVLNTLCRERETLRTKVRKDWLRAYDPLSVEMMEDGYNVSHRERKVAEKLMVEFIDSLLPGCVVQEEDSFSGTNVDLLSPSEAVYRKTKQLKKRLDKAETPVPVVAVRARWNKRKSGNGGLEVITVAMDCPWKISTVYNWFNVYVTSEAFKGGVGD